MESYKSSSLVFVYSSRISTAFGILIFDIRRQALYTGICSFEVTAQCDVTSYSTWEAPPKQQLTGFTQIYHLHSSPQLAQQLHTRQHLAKDLQGWKIVFILDKGTGYPSEIFTAPMKNESASNWLISHFGHVIGFSVHSKSTPHRASVVQGPAGELCLIALPEFAFNCHWAGADELKGGESFSMAETKYFWPRPWAYAVPSTALSHWAKPSFTEFSFSPSCLFYV